MPLRLLAPPAWLRRCALVLLPLLVLLGCDTDGSSLYDPDLEADADPVLSGIAPDPADIVLAGIDVVTLTGENFSEDPDENLVYFDETRAEVLEASATRLVVRAPNVPGDDLDVRVAVLGAENYSEARPYALVSALVPVDAIAPSEEPTGFGTDDAGNLYVMLFAEGAPVGIERIAPDGTRTPYFSTTFPWRDLELGPDGVLVGARGIQALFRLPEGGAQETYEVVSSSADLGSLAFDGAGGLWAGSTSGNIYYVAPGGESFKEFEVPGAVRDVTLFDGDLYAAVTFEGASRIARFPISADNDLGAEETFVALDPSLSADARAIAFAQDGTLFVGTDYAGTGPNPSFRDPILVVGADRIPSVLYGGVLGPQEGGLRVRASSFAWDGGTGLYALRRFERGDGSENNPLVTSFDIVRIETRIQGS